ncbi:MAG: sugar phosphate isomerase/epimerase [Nanoarchaeota archaeon]|nr:sugar phosphate isomerase/epimerase [Nanoarchaeota archaeon]
MKQKLVFGSGTFYKEGLNLKAQRDILMTLDIDGVELCMAQTEEMDEIDDEHISFLRRYDYNILHAPFKKKYLITESNKLEEFERLITLAKKIKAHHIVFHLYNVESLNILSDFPYPFTIENTLTGDWNGDKIIQTVKSNPNCIMTLDTSHAFHFGIKEFFLLTSNLRDKIKHVHLSNIIDGVHHRQFVHVENSLHKLKRIMERLPYAEIITMEENFSNNEDIPKEIELVRKVINNE